MSILQALSHEIVDLYRVLNGDSVGRDLTVEVLRCGDIQTLVVRAVEFLDAA